MHSDTNERDHNERDQLKLVNSFQKSLLKKKKLCNNL